MLKIILNAKIATTQSRKVTLKKNFLVHDKNFQFSSIYLN
jgi:hypothetical protein